MNEDICIIVGALELKEFVVLFEKTQAKSKIRDSDKRSIDRSLQTYASKNLRDFQSPFSTLLGISKRDESRPSILRSRDIMEEIAGVKVS